MKLATRYFLAFAAATTTALVVIGGIDAVSAYRRGVEHVGELQRAQVRVVATHVEAYLVTVSMQLTEVNALPWSAGMLGERDRLDEFHRLLKLNPAIHGLRVVSADGATAASVSRIALDRLHDRAPWELHAAYLRAGRPDLWFGPVYFKDGSTPHVTIAVGGRESASETLVADIDLRYVTDLIASMPFTDGTRAFVVDASDHLIAHPNLSLLHRKVSLHDHSQVVAARSGLAGEIVTRRARSPEHDVEVLTSAAAVAAPRWLVFVEQPLSQVLAPVRALVFRTLAVLAILLVLGLVACRWLARTLTRPIVALQRGAARITSGDLSVRVSTGHADELEALGAEFNRMAESLGRSHGELESKVEQRTRELAIAHRQVQAQATEVAALNRELELRLEELAVKKEEAERANAAKTRFLAAASHDLRQPMQAISLLMEVLRERITGSEARSLADKVQGSVNTLERLFVSLLDISRLDAGAVRPERQDFAIDPLLSVVHANFLPQALSKGLRLELVHSGVAVESDPALLERILGNLVSNAIRYTPSGRVVIGCRRRGEVLRILVVDQGAGIPGHLQGEIFEEFFQVAGVRRERDRGLGLGLSIVKRTADILGHQLFVRSEPGRGSAFGIDVPLARIERLRTALHAIPLDGGCVAGAFVLVIDDDPENRFAIEALCRQWGCSTLAASSADAAIAELRHHLRSPDVVIIDYRLDDRELGTAGLQRIRAELGEEVPAVVVTGDLAIDAGAIANACTGAALLHKPISAGQLLQALGALLAERADAAERPG